MSKSLLVFLAVSLAVLSVLLVRKEHRDATLEDARRASVALAAAGEEVHFKWEYESCPPENSAVYAEWTRRLADAKASSSQASETLGSADPDVQLVSAAISNQEIAMSGRHVQCLEKQGRALDRMRAAREGAARR
jgi:hypothetical protein